MFYTGTIGIDSMQIYQIVKYGWENDFQRHSAIMCVSQGPTWIRVAFDTVFDNTHCTDYKVEQPLYIHPLLIRKF